ncbi:hypothetical protein FHS83_000898 [Rhizomicrobium palustre]|uniref:Uncharacterized protein n=1 Tax=Rhizomicrobium palustre TaxID=189966 RepID=A0A846MX32_9PROT|nr:hypothetical protein [Rhizomicrobium palustre]NIK87580.1 hypothetical protein [Rhizomicrobium palustre]
MPHMLTPLTLSDAKRMLQTDEDKATSLGIVHNIAVVDAGEALIAFAPRRRAHWEYRPCHRQDENSPHVRQDEIQHTIKTISFNDINKNINLMHDYKSSGAR